MARILYTGANGFVGHHFGEYLVANGHDGVPLCRADLKGKKSTVSALFDGVDAVVHLAGRAHRFGKGATKSDAFYTDNVTLTHRILKLASAAAVKRFVFMSSIGVNGPSTDGRAPYTETDTPNPVTAYAQSKWQAEQDVITHCSNGKMQWVIVRPPLIYGDDAKGNWSKLQRLTATGLPLPLSSIQNARSLIHIDNMTAFLAQCCLGESAANQTYVVADGVDASTPVMIRYIANQMDARARLFPMPVSALKWVGRLTGKSKMIDQLTGDLIIDTTKARDQLGWRPVTQPFDSID